MSASTDLVHRGAVHDYEVRLRSACTWSLAQYTIVNRSVVLEVAMSRTRIGHRIGNSGLALKAQSRRKQGRAQGPPCQPSIEP